MNQIRPKRVFPVENQKTEHHHWILHTRISRGTKFQLNLTILIFRTKFTQKAYFRSKKEKLNINNNSPFSDWSRFYLNFSLIWQFWFFGPNLPKKGISGLKQKNHIFAYVHGYRYIKLFIWGPPSRRNKNNNINCALLF